MSNKIVRFSRNTTARTTQPWGKFFRRNLVVGHGQAAAPRLVSIVEQSFRHIGVTCLLTLVVLLVNTPNLPHTHEFHATHFSDSCQSDPCHATIYHQGSANGCNHKFHFTTSEPDCPLCHQILVRQIVPELAGMVEWLTEKAERTFTSVSLREWTQSITHSDRGPPYFS
jgi:hypothetical protein